MLTVLMNSPDSAVLTVPIPIRAWAQQISTALERVAQTYVSYLPLFASLLAMAMAPTQNLYLSYS